MLVVGGTGAFGSRLVAGLVATTDLTVLVAGRDLGRTETEAARRPRERVRAVRLDADEVSADAVRHLGAGIVVDAAGPFQGRAPRLARAAIEAGAHFLDLANARGYVAAFPPRSMRRPAPRVSSHSPARVRCRCSRTPRSTRSPRAGDRSRR